MKIAFIKKLNGRLNLGNIYNHSDQELLSSCFLPKNIKIKTQLHNYNFVVSQGMAGPFWICHGEFLNTEFLCVKKLSMKMAEGSRNI